MHRLDSLRYISCADWTVYATFHAQTGQTTLRLMRRLDSLRYVSRADWTVYATSILIVLRIDSADARLAYMRAVVQRVTEARVEVDGRTVGEINAGLVVLLGVAHDDSHEDAEYLVEKIAHLRIFTDDDGKMNRSVVDTDGAILVVSQFTLYGDVRRGRRPSYSDAAQPELANDLYEYFVEQLRQAGVRVETGVFQAMMKVKLTNDGPVTILLDSRRQF